MIEKRRFADNLTGKVIQEKLDFLFTNPAYTKRLAMYVGKRCQSSCIMSVAEEMKLDWKTVKEMDKAYMQEKIDRADEISPEVIGVDEISNGKGHKYLIVVSDLLRKRPIWIGGNDRSEESLDIFFQRLGAEKCRKIRLIVMDMWKAFEKSARKNISQAAILYDKFHIIRHLGEALDKIRKEEYARVSAHSRKFIKGQKYTLLSHYENLTTDGKRSLKKLFAINKRLNKAYLLKETFGQLWDYCSETWLMKFFTNWKESLKWQRLKPYEKFVKLIERHWEGIAAYCQPENKVPLGFVEGLNNKIRVIQRRAYGLKDQEYLRLKVLSFMLPEIDLNLPT